MPSPTTDTKDAVMTDAPAVFNKSDFTFLKDFDDTVELILTGSEPAKINASVAQLKGRIENARHILEELPGLQFDEDEQARILQCELATLESAKHKLQECLALEQSQPFVQKEPSNDG